VEDRPDSDAIDRIQQEWFAIRSDVDLDIVGIVGRVLRSAALIIRRSDEVLAQHGLIRGEFDILSALRRAGAPQSPGTLRTISLATGPATTKRLHALEQRGLVTRGSNPADGRGSLIALTEAGIRLIDRVFPEQLAAERELVAAIPPEHRAVLTASLRELLASIEQRTTPLPPVHGRFWANS
jgi:DNA-binding MarR family transcriptional regulator